MYLTTKLSKPRNPKEPRQVNESLVSVSAYQKIGDTYQWVDLILEQDKYEIYRNADECLLVSGKLKVNEYKGKLYYSIYVNFIKAVAWADYDRSGQPSSNSDKRTNGGSKAKQAKPKSMTTKDVKVNNQTDPGDNVFGDIDADDTIDIDGLF